MAFNPFLSTAEVEPTQYAPAPASHEQVASNPFLSGFGAEISQRSAIAPSHAPAEPQNPFLSFAASPAPDYSMQQQPQQASIPKNPFADFVSAEPEPEPPINAFGGYSTESHELLGGGGGGGMDQTNMSLIDTTDSLLYDEGNVSSHSTTYIPCQTTQDLLSSVTGALEATSDSLLDRLRVTQPSPTHMMPSPSPRSPSPEDLLGYHDTSCYHDTSLPPAPPPSANTLNASPQADPMDIFGSSLSGSQSKPKTSFEILDLYNTSSATNTTTSIPSQMAVMPSSLIEPEHIQTIQTVDPLISIESEIKTEPQQEESTIVDQTHTISSPQIEEEIKEIPLEMPNIVNNNNEVLNEEIIISSYEQEKEQPMEIEKPKEQEIFKPESSPSRPPPPSVIRTKPPDRPKPPVPAPPPPVKSPTRSPINDNKIFPSRPPPPVPPAPRVQQSKPEPPPPPPPKQRVEASPFAQPAVQMASSPFSEPVQSIPAETKSPFGQPASIFQEQSQSATNIFASPTQYTETAMDISPKFESKPSFSETKPSSDAFDDFETKFNMFGDGTNSGGGGGGNDPFGGSTTITAPPSSSPFGATDSAWGGGGSAGGANELGFGNDEGGYDAFLSLTEPPPVPQSTPAKSRRGGDSDDDDFEREEVDLSIIIKPRGSNEELSFGLAPALAPPPKSPAMSTGSAYSEENTSFVPFLSSGGIGGSSGGGTSTELPLPTFVAPQQTKSDSLDSPQTPLFDEDTSVPLEDFPRIKYLGEGWDMHMRHPNKKKITGQRFWKKVFVRIGYQNDLPIVHIYNNKMDRDPFQEIPLQPCYSMSDIGAQQFDQYGKTFTAKIQYIFYKERPGVRPGQISKAERITNKLSQFAKYAIEGDYQGVKEFGSDLKKLGIPVEHHPQVSQLAKLATTSFEDMKQFSVYIEELLFRLPVHRDRSMTYKTEEIQVTIVDEYYVEHDIYGIVQKQIARVRLMFLSFLSGMPEIEMGLNDVHRQGKEVVGRHDIIPIATEEWIRIEDVEFSTCVQLDEYDRTKTIKFIAPDACYIELVRFRIRPPRQRELPLQVKTVITTTGKKIEIRCDILVPGFTSRKLGQIPCEDVMVRFPIPETWIYMFRVEKHFRYGSVKSAHRRTGKVKGIERFLGAVEAVEQSLMEVTSGQAKYEHPHRAIVWRIGRLPKDGQGAYTTHSFFCHVQLQPHEEVPENLTKYCFVEFTMPHTTVSHTVCRSISVPNCDEPPEKYVRYLSRHEYIVEIEYSQGVQAASYAIAAATTKKAEPEPEKPVENPAKNGGKLAESDSDFSD